MRQVGIFGGTFDPPHVGHLILAEHAVIGLELDDLLFVPTYRSPFKQDQPTLGAETRCEMVELAVVDNRKFQVDYSEARNPEVSYTIDTVDAILRHYPEAKIFILMGADAYMDFPSWKEPDEIVKRATIGVALRPGFRLDLTKHPYGEFARIFPMPLIDISSTEIRARIREGRSIRYLVPWTVQTFIEANRLYR